MSGISGCWQDRIGSLRKMPISLHSWSVPSQRDRPPQGFALAPLLKWKFPERVRDTRYMLTLKTQITSAESLLHRGGPRSSLEVWREMLQAGRMRRKGMRYANTNATLLFHRRVPSSFQERLYRVFLSGPNSSLLLDILELPPTSQTFSSSVASACVFLAFLSFFPQAFWPRWSLRFLWQADPRLWDDHASERQSISPGMFQMCRLSETFLCGWQIPPHQLRHSVRTRHLRVD